MDILSGVGVLDKAMVLLGAVEHQPRSLAGLVDATGIPRPTAHRLAVALEQHGVLRRDAEGRFTLGFRLVSLGRAAIAAAPLADVAGPVLAWLHDQTGESVQLFVRDGDARVCVAAVESGRELRTIVPVGARLPLAAGSAGRVLAGEAAGARGWIESVAEREEGVASVSAPVQDGTGTGGGGGIVAAVSVSGPIPRTTRLPGRRYGDPVVAAARRIEERCGVRN